MIIKGGFGEPYCSQACYDNGGKYAAAVMLKNQTGVCVDPSTTYFPELQNRFPPTDGALSVQKLTAETANAARKSKEQAEIFIIVHPAYSHFFRDLEKDSTHAAKFRLEKKQFESEAIMIGSHAASGAVMVLVIPGDYFEESKAPRSYVSYLNTVTAGGRSIYYVLSAASSSGTLPAEDMVNLYTFIQATRARKVLIGGGFIGRCQREFYNQLTNYLDRRFAYIVPELSTISPDDVSEEEALEIASSLDRYDYSPVKDFIDKKSGGTANILSIPVKQEP